MKFNEDSRVKIPSILHLMSLGYSYLSLKNEVRDEETNIFTDIFKQSIRALNEDIEENELEKLLQELTDLLGYEDLGKAFYERLTQTSGIKLIDFENFTNNTLQVVTELTYKNGDDEFRPDIILLINGLPLVFIEVKKPNNKEGVLAEKSRIETRFENKKFNKFMNITQLMIFSNNMEYDDANPETIEGAFYATASKSPMFNYFREEEKLNLAELLTSLPSALEDSVLKDNNLEVIKHNAEFITNKEPNTPTNRIITSLLSPERVAFMLRYSLAYVKSSSGLQKHIMRYPQVFATKAIEAKLDEGIKKGIIWHTQGSGKTALAYYNVKYLSDYFTKKAVIAKFYFIVDRIDLLIQAKREFSSRGLIVHTVASRQEFAKDIKATTAIHNDRGQAEITVVNIQKFDDDPDVMATKDYDINIQRVYFLDEVHRSYNPKGSFLANLTTSDPNAIKIGLTGTPLLGDEYNSKSLFGDYIHKYYYNASIADGYTLRLIREEIETSYKLHLQKILEEIDVLQGDFAKKQIYSHHSFVEPMLEYIVEDCVKSRKMFCDASMGAMVVCDSSEQAKKMSEIFEIKYAQIIQANNTLYEAQKVAEQTPLYGKKIQESYDVKSSALILHDVGTKQERKDKVEAFKEGKIDILFVYNMLLTGFDAPRLKKLYLGRIIKNHNLLQTLTRVNRTYKKFKYGYVVDFADISKEFDATNKAYFDELQSELGDEMEHYSSLFKSRQEIEEEIQNIKETLFEFDTSNAEIFSQQISQIQDPKKMQEIRKVLGDATSLYNLIRLFGHFDLLEKIDFAKLNILYREASNHLTLLNQKNAIESNDESVNILNYALEDILFKFTKISEDELILADKLKNTLRQTREALSSNFDKKDPEFISLKEELERLFKSKNLNAISQSEMSANIGTLKKIHEKINELNRRNALLKHKYEEDAKYARIHKRLMQNETLSKKQSKIHEALMDVKKETDEKVLNNSGILDNERYFSKLMMRTIIQTFKKAHNIEINPESTSYISSLVLREYINEYNGEIYW